MEETGLCVIAARTWFIGYKPLFFQVEKMRVLLANVYLMV